MTTSIISVGNGGYNVASELIKANVFPGAQFIVCNTDASLLEKNGATASKSFLLDKINHKISSKDIGVVDEVLADTSDTIVVCATLGGKCGSAYAPLVALNAILQGNKVCSIITLPYRFEGKATILRASKAQRQIIMASELTFIQDNKRLNQIDELCLNGMNKPIVDTMLSALKTHTLSELMEIKDKGLRDSLIPSSYHLDVNALIELRGPISYGITPEDRKAVFDSLT